MPSTVKESESP